MARASLPLLAPVALFGRPAQPGPGAFAQEMCPGGGFDPSPTPVAVDTVPIVVGSTTDEYFVLYVRSLDHLDL